MNNEIFDIKQARRCRTLRRNKNNNSVLPLKTMTFLVTRNPTVFPERTARFSKPDMFDKSSQYSVIQFLSAAELPLALHLRVDYRNLCFPCAGI